MTGNMPKDVSAAEWADNPSIAQADQFCSLVASGFWNRELKIPITLDRLVCFECHRLYAPEKYARVFRRQKIIEALESPVPVLRDGILFTGNAAHWHFMIDGLGCLTAPSFSRTNIVYVDEELSDDQVAYLAGYIAALASVRPEIIRINAGNYRLENVVVPHRIVLAGKVARIRNILKLDPGQPGHGEAGAGGKLVYVSRKLAATRRMVSEQEFCELLARHVPVQTILAEKLNLADQAEYFRDAEAVIGPHGAGLTNIIFSTRPRLLVEFFHSTHQPFFKFLANAMNIEYLAIEGRLAQPVRDRKRIDNNDFTIVMEDAVRAIRNALREAAELVRPAAGESGTAGWSPGISRKAGG